MQLAKNKYGQIGRQQPSVGLEAQVVSAPMAEIQRDVYVSQSSVEQDNAQKNQAEWAQNQRRLQRQLELAEIKRERAQKERLERRAILNEQAQKIDPINEQLKSYFAMQGTMGETEKVVSTLLPPNPADFSASGGNLQYVPGLPVTGGDQFWADFRQERIVGNPLTRDGIFGPRTTDYDRFVAGEDVNQTNVVKIAGGTMLGRYHMDGTMGQTQSWTDWLTGLGQEVVGEKIRQELGPKPTTPSVPAQVIETRYLPSGTSTQQVLMYAGIGLGVLALAYVLMRKK